MARLDTRLSLYGEKRLSDAQCRALAVLAAAGGRIVRNGDFYRHDGAPFAVQARTMEALRICHHVSIDAVDGQEVARINDRGRKLLADIGLSILVKEVLAERDAAASQERAP